MTTGIQSGKLRHEVNIRATTQSGDGAGGLPDSWATVATVFASIEQAEEKEELSDGTLQVVATHQIIIRWYDGLTVSHRILFGTRIFEIVSIDNRLERKFKHVLKVLERSA